MSVFDKIFGPAKPQIPLVPGQPAPTASPPTVPMTNNLQQPPHTGTVETGQTAANGVVPNDGSAKAEVSPVAKFDTLWEPPKPDESDPNASSQAFDPQKMMEAAGKVDFTKVVDRETLQKIAAGGDDAVNAFAAALNKTAQTVFGQSTVVAQKLIEKASQTTREELLAQIPGLVKKQQLSESMMADNPAFNSPAVQPVIQSLQSQLAEKYPKASAGELRTMAMEYLTGVSTLINPPKQTATASNPKSGDDVDWEKYLSS